MVSGLSDFFVSEFAFLMNFYFQVILTNYFTQK